MKYLKRFNESLSDFKIKVVDAYPNNYDGNVQIDLLNIECNGNEYYFENSTASGYIHIKYLGTDGDDQEFLDFFNLVEDETFSMGNGGEDDKFGLTEFLSENDPSCEGNVIEIDGYEIEITIFSHDGGKEFGVIEAIINGEDIQFEIEQEGSSFGGGNVSFADEENEKIGQRIGFVLDAYAQEYLFMEYDRICSENR